MQVSHLVRKMKDESKVMTESTTRKHLREKIAGLPQLRLARAIDVLAMTWMGVTRSLDSPVNELKSAHSTLPAVLPNWRRVKVALLKSIPTGTFIDVQFYAHNAIGNDLTLDPRPLFTSRIVIEDWGSTLVTRK